MGNVYKVTPMGRPAGHQMNRQAWDDVLRLTGLSLTRVSELADIPRVTLSSLAGGHHRASVTQAHQLANALSVYPETLFPTLLPHVERVA